MPGFVVPPVSAKPTGEQVEAALDVLQGVIGQFPYESDTDAANGYAGLITPFITRPGPVPTGVFDAPQAGSGKSLLAGAIQRTATGQPPDMQQCAATDEEWRKQFTTLFIAGDRIVVFDNLNTPLNSGSFCRAVTAPVWSDRVLSTNRGVSVPNEMITYVTGNNVQIGGDMPRRCYRVRLNPESPRPWRDGRTFRHPDLDDWIAANRGTVVHAVLTVIRAWYANGQVDYDPPMIRGFDKWCRRVGNILAGVGIEGFLGNVDEMYETADDGSAEWEHFLSVLQHRHGSDRFTVAQVATDVCDDAAVRDALPDKLPDSVKQHFGQFNIVTYQIPDLGRFKIRLGKAFKERVGRRYGDGCLYLTRDMDPHSKVAIWQVVGNPSPAAGSAGSGRAAAGVSDSTPRDQKDMYESDL